MKSVRCKPEFKWWDSVFGLLGSLLALGAWVSGLTTNFFVIFLMAYLPVALAIRLWAAFERKLETGFVRRPFAPEHRWFLIQAVVWWSFLVVWLLVLRTSIVPLQLGDSFKSAWTLFVLLLAGSALIQLFPKKIVLAGRIIFLAGMTLFFGAQLVIASVPVSSADVITMRAPIRSEMLVFQGGRSPLLNHHFLRRSQRDALDLVVLKNGKQFEGSETELSSHACFGEPIYAPLSGTIIKVVKDLPDMSYGQADRAQVLGNHVVLQVAEERFVLFAHLKQGSVLVRDGEEIESGSMLAQCGNSGNTSGPHLHLQVQNRPEFTSPDLRTFPIVFRDAVVIRGSESRNAEVLRRNDRVRPTGSDETNQ